VVSRPAEPVSHRDGRIRSDLAADPRTDDEIWSSRRVPEGFAWLSGAADEVIAWSGRHLLGQW
jgi:hypothetical protein